MLEIIFTTILYVNVLMMFVSFFFVGVLLKRAKGNPIYFNFGMSDLFLGLWMLVTLLDYFRLTPFASLFHARLGFLAGIWILHYFFIFTFYFPFPKKLNKYFIPLLYSITIIVSIVTMMPFSIISASVDFPFRTRVVDSVYLTLYIIYFGLLMSMSLHNLFKSFELSDGIAKIQTRKVLIGTSLALLANLIFSLINFYYTSFDLTPIGMFFTFGVLIYIYSILFSKSPI